MNWKVIVLIICAGYGVWFATVGGKQIKEEHVHKLYSQLQTTSIRGEMKEYCDLISDEVSGKIRHISRQQLIDKEDSVNKTMLCSSAEQFRKTLDQLKDVAERRRQSFSVQDNFELVSVTISPDKKTATVETVGDYKVSIGGKLVFSIHSTSTDQVKRSFGKTRVVHIDGISTTRAYAPR